MTNVNRREFLTAAGSGLLAFSDSNTHSPAACSARLLPAGPPLSVSDRKQLFIDNLFIAASEHVSLTMNPAQKMGIVLESSEPWERGTGGFFRVIEDGGKAKMYYGAFTEAGHSLCYAESTDGLRWTKPALGLVSVNGNKNNNIIYADNAIDATIMVDPRDVPERRYKIFRSNLSNNPEHSGLSSTLGS